MYEYIWFSGSERWSMRSRPHDGGLAWSPSTPTTVFCSMSTTLGSVASVDSCDFVSRAPKPLIAVLNVPRIVAPESAWAAANAVAATPARSVTMYSSGIGSPMARSSMVRGIVVDVVDVDELVEVVDVVDVEDVDVVDVVDELDDVDDVDEVLDELDDVDDVVDVLLDVDGDTDVVDELDDEAGTVVVVVVVLVEVLVDDDELLELDEELDELVVDDVTDTVVVVVDSMVSITDITESGSTTNTCESAFRRRTSLLSSSATKPFTLLANTLLTSLPSDSSLRTFAATLTVSFRMTM